MNDGRSAMRRSFRLVSVAGLFAALAVAGCQERDRGGQAGAEVRKGGEGAAVQPGAPPGEPQQQGQQPGVAAEPIRDVTIVLVAPDRATFNNRMIDLVGAQVQKVSNDKVFWIGPSEDRTVPVVLDEQAASSLKDRQLKIQKGDRVALVGQFRQSPSVQQLQQQWALSSQEAEELTRSQVYIHVTRILVGATQGGVEQPGTPGGQQPGQQQGQQPGQQPGTQGGQQR
ncbi:hypothetical protein [Polyangium spumosum]|uniref:Uncharacterized protein n=1 Tax=Polyangium spumosum TaxID=889282 RepID=A0A6N7Q090_9BACT|nr:hypothetical protein [Polyangium spumosum]MRG96556.1 hypothetical protein [Polyangium spumosum]